MLGHNPFSYQLRFTMYYQTITNVQCFEPNRILKTVILMEFEVSVPLGMLMTVIQTLIAIWNDNIGVYVFLNPLYSTRK